MDPKHFLFGITGNIHEYEHPIRQRRRNKRNAQPLEKPSHNQSDELQKITTDADDLGRPLKPEMNDDVRKELLKTIKSDEYRDYAFDTTDTDQFNEDDDLLRRYYTFPVKRAITYDGFGSFSDLMHLISAQEDRDGQYVKRLHYGNENGLLNDESNDVDNDNDDDSFNSEFGYNDDY